MNWDDLKLFLAVARAGGLSAAAEATGKSAPTLGRRILSLEASTGGELFNRHARGYELTEQGEALLKKVLDLEARISTIDRASDGENPVLVKVSAGNWMTQALCERIGSIVTGNDATRIRFIAADHELDIAHRETIIGIRNQRPVRNGLACRRVGKVIFAGYARKKSIQNWVRVMGKTPSAAWLAAQPGTATPVEVTSPRNALDIALAGGGRVLLPAFVGNAQKQLLRVTPSIAELTHEQWLVTHQDERYRPQVRQTIDRIFDVLKSLHRVDQPKV